MELKMMIADEVEDRELAQKVVRYAVRAFLMEPEYSLEWV